jgi:glycosyltransferase involved in cell wall biosynthesis
LQALTSVITRSDTHTLLSINRFEGKKNIGLAVEAFAKVRKEHPKLRLIVAGKLPIALYYSSSKKLIAHLLSRRF